MTWKGYVAIRGASARRICLSVGKREFAGIEQIEKTLEKLMDLEVYEVAYRTTVPGAPDWVRTPEAAGLFPDLAALIEDRVHHAKLVRGSDGWRSAMELELEAAAATRSGEEAEAARKVTDLLLAEPPARDLVEGVFEEQLQDRRWAERHAFACLPIRIPRGGDDHEARRAGNGPYTVTYTDRPERPKHEFQAMATTLNLLSALEAAGLASIEYLEPSGVRYRVSDEAISALELGGNEGCVPAGKLSISLLGSDPGPAMVQVSARATVSESPAWVLELARHLPALRSLIEHGMPMGGTIGTITPDGESELRWQGGGLSPAYPVPEYHSLPSHLVPVLPLTAAASPASSIRAPTFRTVRAIEPARPVPETVPRRPASPLAEKDSDPAKPPFPARGSPVHVVSIYEGQLPPGVQGSFGEHPEGTAHVTVRAPGATLLLGAYEPVEWRIDAPKGINIRRIIVIGQHDQRVKVSGGSRPEVVTGNMSTLLKPQAATLPSRLPTRTDGNSLVDVANIVQALTGETPMSFQALYAAPAGGFTIEPGSARFALPEVVRPGMMHGTVGFRDGDSARGLEVIRGRGAGGISDASADRSYSAGRVYFEGTMRVTGSVSAHTYANAGICLSHGEGGPKSQALAIRHGGQKLHADGDVFGVAADLDRGRVYFRVNGRWINGEPGAAGGAPLEVGKTYCACFFAAGTSAGESSQSDTTWIANFGGQRFADTVPAGYVPYE
jgi:hypothetical protein